MRRGLRLMLTDRLGYPHERWLSKPVKSLMRLLLQVVRGNIGIRCRDCFESQQRTKSSSSDVISSIQTTVAGKEASKLFEDTERKF